MVPALQAYPNPPSSTPVQILLRPIVTMCKRAQLMIAWSACSPKRRTLKQLQALALAGAQAGGEAVAGSPAAKGPAAAGKATAAGKTPAKVSNDFFCMH